MGAVVLRLPGKTHLTMQLGYSAMLLICLVLPASVLARHGRTVRRGEMSSNEMRLVHQLMETIADDGDMERMVVLDPPVSGSHREEAVRCNLGSKSYCPGETLFRVGAAKVKAKVCTETGKFSTITVPSNYKEPQRCQHRATEYCDGEMLRGFMAWSFVQQCGNGRLQLQAMHHGAMVRAMQKFRGNQSP